MRPILIYYQLNDSHAESLANRLVQKFGPQRVQVMTSSQSKSLLSAIYSCELLLLIVGKVLADLINSALRDWNRDGFSSPQQPVLQAAVEMTARPAPLIVASVGGAKILDMRLTFTSKVEIKTSSLIADFASLVNVINRVLVESQYYRDGGAAPPLSVVETNFAVARVLYATDRNRTSGVKPAEMFGSSRATLSYGYCDVSIPRDHRMGELESPSIWRFEFRENPAKHVVLLGTVVKSKDEFFRDIVARVRKSARSSAFLFVHGYNVTFENAARRTAQMSYDLSFEGAPVFYSWPSQGTTLAYTFDEQNVEWAQANLMSFLEDFFTRSEAQNVYLIAHSMGNRALTRALSSLLTDKPTLQSRLREVILTAPDIDADVFKRDIAPALTATGRSVTLYASSEDLALVASKKVHGYPRAGDSGQGLVVVPGVETIDATNVDTSLIGHSYFAETRSVLSDMFYLIRNGERADNRFGLRRVDAQAGRYWEFKP